MIITKNDGAVDVSGKSVWISPKKSAVRTSMDRSSSSSFDVVFPRLSSISRIDADTTSRTMPPGIDGQHTTLFFRQIVHFLCETGKAQPRVPCPMVAYYDGSIRKLWWCVVDPMV